MKRTSSIVSVRFGASSLAELEEDGAVALPVQLWSRKSDNHMAKPNDGVSGVIVSLYLTRSRPLTPLDTELAFSTATHKRVPLCVSVCIWVLFVKPRITLVPASSSYNTNLYDIYEYGLPEE